jgi:hypothetical protein
MEMKQKGFWAGILASMLVFGLGFVSCGGDDDDDPPGLNLPPITEETIGQESIAVTDEPLIGDAPDGEYTWGEYTGRGFTATVTGGKLSFTLGTPDDAQLQSFSQLLNGLWYECPVSATDGDQEETLTPSVDTAKYYWFSTFHNAGDEVRLFRSAVATDNATYYKGSYIDYFYVDKDVTLTRAALTITDDDGDIDSYAAVSLPLQKGWNLVQTDFHVTISTTSYITTNTSYIATKNVPWIVYYTSRH